ncbi:MAG TPA: DUF4214 domain-containing protein [Iamia sp.]|nr:DUF4214 domain-containing protein [Iamia sp.]
MATGAALPAPAVTQTAPDRCYTGTLIEVFLDHPASVYEIQQWADRVGPGPVRPALPRALAVSDEWLEAVVVGIYDAALDRPPGVADLGYWIDRLRAGERVVTLTALVYGSPEVYARAGSTAPGFVADVFPRIMGRAPTSADVSYWAGEVPRRGRGGVAKALVGSVENRRARVTTLYQEILGRTPDTAGRDYWVGRLTTIDDVQLAVQLASSAEAYDRAVTQCAVPPAPVTTQYTNGQDGNSTSASISDDGHWVAFTSTSPDLVPGDDETKDLFLLDRTTGAVTKVTDTNASIRSVALSADGRHVVFLTNATDLLPGDGDGHADVFSWDRQTDTFTRITDGNDDSGFPDVSADGRYVTFSSDATDLLTGDGDDEAEDIFVWDRTAGLTELVSEGDRSFAGPQISADGGRIIFQDKGAFHVPPTLDMWERTGGTTTAILTGDVSPLDVTDDGDVAYAKYGVNVGSLSLRDGTTGAITVISEGDNATPAADIAADGATVAFTSWANGLFPGDTIDSPDVFVWERATGAVAHIGATDTDESSPTTSADGRYVAFHRRAHTFSAWAQIAVWDRGS